MDAGEKLPQKTKDKMRESQLALITPEEKERRSRRAKENGYGKWMKGRPAHPKFVEAAKARKGKNYEEIYGKDRAEEEIIKRAKGNTGVVKTYTNSDAKEKLKTAVLRKGKNYEEIYGKDRAEEEIIKRSQSHLKRWEGKERLGCRDKINGEHKYKEWRLAVFERDAYTCQECGKGGRLHAHHIKPWASYEKLRYILSNGVTLCPICHSKYHPKIKCLINA